MRVIAALGLAALTGMVSAHPHGHAHHHDKRAVVVDVVTEVEWVTIHPGDVVAEPTSTEAAVVATSTSEPVVQVAVQVASTSSTSSSLVQPTPIVTPTWTTSSSVVASSTSDVIETATATGGSGVNIVNNIGKTIYLWTTSETSGEMVTIEEDGTYYEDWQINSDGGGISIKLSTSTTEDSVLQFEYTKEDETIWWDMSSINLLKTSLFVEKGFSVTSNDASCSTVTCDAGDEDCSESYQLPDDVDTRSCSSSAAFTLTLGA
ncbi:Secreted thaumatin-like protein calA [Penicillium frequentans]|uniref:Secreted thaumatin-like protein calA n=1 Tax=Penicillium frequentans TaxID=3151616 RepID=A0AAD6CKT4_9EURO|nr:Secreted thaumatin-like protein calA [Penicillium glabrum]